MCDVTPPLSSSIHLQPTSVHFGRSPRPYSAAASTLFLLGPGPHVLTPMGCTFSVSCRKPSEQGTPESLNIPTRVSAPGAPTLAERSASPRTVVRQVGGAEWEAFKLELTTLKSKLSSTELELKSLKLAAAEKAEAEQVAKAVAVKLAAEAAAEGAAAEAERAAIERAATATVHKAVKKEVRDKASREAEKARVARESLPRFVSHVDWPAGQPRFISHDPLLNSGWQSPPPLPAVAPLPPPTPPLPSLRTRAEYEAQLKQAGSKLVAIDFTAGWCGPCQRIWPIFVTMQEEFPNVVFTKLDVRIFTWALTFPLWRSAGRTPPFGEFR